MYSSTGTQSMILCPGSGIAKDWRWIDISFRIWARGIFHYSQSWGRCYHCPWVGLIQLFFHSSHSQNLASIFPRTLTSLHTFRSAMRVLVKNSNFAVDTIWFTWCLLFQDSVYSSINCYYLANITDLLGRLNERFMQNTWHGAWLIVSITKLWIY